MIDRQKGKLVLECDSCAEVFEGDNGDFGEVWSDAKRDGWSTYRIGEQWMHRCPRCGSRPKAKR